MVDLPKNEYDDIYDQMENNKVIQFNAAKMGAASVNPDIRAGYVNLAAQTGIPVDVVERNPQEAEKILKSKTNEYDEIYKNNPVLAEWVSNPDNFKVASDDVDGLDAVGNALGRAWVRGKTMLEQSDFEQYSEAARDKAKSFTEIVRDSRVFKMANSPAAVLDVFNRWIKSRAIDDAQGKAEQSGLKIGELGKELEEYPFTKDVQELFTKLSDADKKGWTETLGVMASNPLDVMSAVGQIGIEMAPILAATVAVSAATRSPAAVMSFIGGSSGLMERYTGPIDFLQSKGVDFTDLNQVRELITDPNLMREAESYGLTRQIIIGGVDTLTGGLASKVFGGTIRNMATQMGIQMVGGGGGEALAQLSTTGEIKPSEVILEALAEFITAPIDVASMGMAKYNERGIRIKKAENAQNTKEAFQAMADTSEASKLRGRLPERFKNFVEQATKDGPVSEVYIDAQEFKQYFQDSGIDPFELFDEVPAIREQMEEAAALGGQIIVPIADFATYIAPSEHFQGLANSLKIHSSDMSMNESTAFEAQKDAYAEEIMRSIDKGEELRTDNQKVYDKWFHHLRVAGQSPDTAKYEAAQAAAWFNTAAERNGTSALEEMKALGIRIQGPIPESLTKKSVDDIDFLIDAIREDKLPRQGEAFGRTLLEFARERGIKDDQGDLAAMDIDKGLLKDKRKLAHQQDLLREDGMQIDDVALAAQEHGFFPDLGDERVTIDQFLEAISNEQAGVATYTEQEYDAKTQERLQAADDLTQFLDDRGIDINTATNEEIKAALNEDFAVGDEYNQDGVLKTDTDAFKKWFGDSKVVDEAGKPLVVHHGGFGAASIEEFSPDYGGQTTGNNEHGAFHFTDNLEVAEDYGRQSFNRRFQDSPEMMADEVELPKGMTYDEDVGMFVDKDGKTFEPYDLVGELVEDNIETQSVYLKIDNPYTLDMEGKQVNVQQIEELSVAFMAMRRGDFSNIPEDAINTVLEMGKFDPDDITDYQDEINARALENNDLDNIGEAEDYQIEDATREVLEENGIEQVYPEFDGIIITNMVDDIGDMSKQIADQFIVFDPTQIKSIHNRGTWDASDPRILYQSSKAQGSIISAANKALQDSIEYGAKFDIDDVIKNNGLIDNYDNPIVINGGLFTKEQANGKSDFTIDYVDLTDEQKKAFHNPLEGDGYNPNYQVSILPEDLEVFISDYPTDFNISEEDLQDELSNSFATLEIKDVKSLEKRLKSSEISEKEISSIEEAFSNPNHHIRAAAFRAALDQLSVEYRQVGTEGIASEYIYIEDPGRTDGSEIKVRFADHGNQSRLHESADYNISDGDYENTLKYLSEIANLFKKDTKTLYQRDLKELDPVAVKKILSKDSVDIGLKVGKKARFFRGVNQTSGDHGATYGRGLYVAGSHADAKEFGRVIEMDINDLPSNPLRFQTINDYQVWLQRAYSELGYKGPREFNKDFPDLDVFIKSLDQDIDGIQIGRGKDTLFVNYGGRKVFSQKDTKGPRGSITFGNTETLINLFSTANRSTFLHEAGHLYLQQFESLANRDGAPEQIKDDWQLIRENLGLKDGEPITRRQHEQFADTFLAYAFEGKSPSLALREAFIRFSSWLKQLYKKVLDINPDIKLTDDIRGVFDRMLATDEEIASAQAQMNMEALFEDAESGGMTEIEFKKYQDGVRAAASDAHEEVQLKLLRQLGREQKKTWKAERAKVVLEVTDNIYSAPIYQAHYLLSRGKFYDGTVPKENIKISSTSLKEQYGETALKHLPKSVPPIHVKEGGYSLDHVGELFGMSGADLFKGLNELIPAKKLIEQQADEVMYERYGNMLNDGSIHEEAIAAVQNDAQGKVLALELQMLHRKQGRKIPSPASVAKAVAVRLIGEKKTSEAIRFSQYAAASARAARETEQHIAKKDFNAAAESKRKQLINHYMYMESRNASEKVDSLLRYMGKFSRKGTRKNIDVDYLDQIDAIMERFDFRKGVSEKAIKRRASLVEWVKSQEEQGKEVIIPDKVLNEAYRISYKALPLNEVYGIKDSIKNVEYLGRKKKEYLINKDKREFLEVKNDVVDGIYASNKLKPVVGAADHIGFDATAIKNRLKTAIADADAAHLKIERIVGWMDGEALGASHKAIIQPIADAEAWKNDKNAAMAKEFEIIMNKIPQAQRANWFRGRMTINQLIDHKTGKPIKMQRGSLMMIALHSGTESNMGRLIDGHGWTKENIMAALDEHITQEEWVAIQEIWALIDSLRPEIFADEKGRTGVEPTKIEGWEVYTKFGVVQGSYFPIVYDGELSVRASQIHEKGALFENNYTRPTTKSGSTIERLHKTGMPLSLDISAIAHHIQKEVHVLAYRDAVTAVDKLTSDPDFVLAVEETLGKSIHKLFRPWLHSIANDAFDVPAETFIGKTFQRLRIGTTVVAMGWKISTAIQQPLGYTQSLFEISKHGNKTEAAAYLATGIKSFAKNPIDAYAFVTEKSGEIRHRQGNFDRDVRAKLRSMAYKTGKLIKIQETYFRLTALADMSVVIPTWIGAYNKGLKDFNADEQKAIQFADKMVRLSQGTGSMKDLASIQRGSEFQRLLTMFYSYFNTLYNAMRDSGRRVNQEGGVPRFVADMFFLIVIPSLLSEIITGRGPDEDDEIEDIAKWAAIKVATYPFMGVVGVRDFANAVSSKIEGKNYGYKLTPVGQSIETLIWFGDDIADEFAGKGDHEQTLKHGLLSAGYIFGLPVKQPMITIEAINDYLDGEDVEFKDFFLSKPKK